MIKILIAYTSTTGTTKEIAYKIAEDMKSEFLEIEVKDISENIKLSKYDCLVLGSPLNGMKVLPEFNKFIMKEEIKDKVVAAFIISYVFREGRSFWKKAINKEMKRIKQIVPNTIISVFGGRIKEPMPKFANFLFGIKKNTPLDLRNWEEIDNWSKNLRRYIKSNYVIR